MTMKKKGESDSAGQKLRISRRGLLLPLAVWMLLIFSLVTVSGW